MSPSEGNHGGSGAALGHDEALALATRKQDQKMIALLKQP